MIDFLMPVLQALLFYLIPTSIGRVAVKRLFKDSISYPLVTYFITGGFIVFALALVIKYVFLTIFSALSFSLLFSWSVALLAGGSAVYNILLSREDLNLRSYLTPLSLSLLCVSVIYMLWRIDSPYPFNWDMLEHQTLVNNIFNDRYSFMTTRVTDTFGFSGYSTFYHTLLAASQIFHSPNMFTYWSAIGFIHFYLVVFASYLMAKEVTENKAVAYIAMLLAAGIFDSYVSFTSLFFIPQTFTAVIFIFLTSQLFKEIKKGKLISGKLVGLNSLFLFLNHYIIGAAAVGVYLVIYFYSKFRLYIAKHINRAFLIGALAVLAIVAVILSAYIPLDFLNAGEAASFNPTFAEKLRVMLRVYGFLLLIFLPIGLITTLKAKGEVEIFILTLTFGLLALVLLQIPYVMKFYVLARFFIHLIAAIGIYAVIRLISPLWQRIAAYSLLVVAIITLFITNSAGWKEILRYQEGYTNISPNEVQAAKFLYENYRDTDTLLVTDPATQHILEPLSMVNTPGGAYMNLSTRNNLDQLIKTNDHREMAELISEIKDGLTGDAETKLIAVSGRYYLWQYSNPEDKESLSFNIWYPSDMTLDNYQNLQYMVENNDYFEVVYQNPTISIIEVKQP